MDAVGILKQYVSEVESVAVSQRCPGGGSLFICHREKPRDLPKRGIRIFVPAVLGDGYVGALEARHNLMVSPDAWGR